MASTRNRNTPQNYKMFINEQTKYSKYDLYENSSAGEIYDPKYAGNGLNGGKFSRNNLAHNHVSVESQLFGINATNLVNPATPVTPQNVNLRINNLFEKSPVYMPAPLIVSTTQRPSQWN
jgi:hypothetical protein